MWLESSLEPPDSLHLENKVDSSHICSKSFTSEPPPAARPSIFHTAPRLQNGSGLPFSSLKSLPSNQKRPTLTLQSKT